MASPDGEMESQYWAHKAAGGFFLMGRKRGESYMFGGR
jgi:hypothetical protein